MMNGHVQWLFWTGYIWHLLMACDFWSVLSCTWGFDGCWFCIFDGVVYVRDLLLSFKAKCVISVIVVQTSQVFVATELSYLSWCPYAVQQIVYESFSSIVITVLGRKNSLLNEDLGYISKCVLSHWCGKTTGIWLLVQVLVHCEVKSAFRILSRPLCHVEDAHGYRTVWVFWRANSNRFFKRTFNIKKFKFRLIRVTLKFYLFISTHD